MYTFVFPHIFTKIFLKFSFDFYCDIILTSYFFHFQYNDYFQTNKCVVSNKLGFYSSIKLISSVKMVQVLESRMSTMKTRGKLSTVRFSVSNRQFFLLEVSFTYRASEVAQAVKSLPAVRKTQV